MARIQQLCSRIWLELKARNRKWRPATWTPVSSTDRIRPYSADISTLFDTPSNEIAWVSSQKCTRSRQSVASKIGQTDTRTQENAGQTDTDTVVTVNSLGGSGAIRNTLLVGVGSSR